MNVVAIAVVGVLLLGAVAVFVLGGDGDGDADGSGSSAPADTSLVADLLPWIYWNGMLKGREWLAGPGGLIAQ